MMGQTNNLPKEKCTVVESIYGDVKLIKRSHEFGSSLVTLSFSNLTDCLEYVDRNRFHISVMYSGRRRTENGKY